VWPYMPQAPIGAVMVPSMAPLHDSRQLLGAAVSVSGLQD
jgi:hypothetical protein